MLGEGRTGNTQGVQPGESLSAVLFCITAWCQIDSNNRLHLGRQSILLLKALRTWPELFYLHSVIGEISNVYRTLEVMYPPLDESLSLTLTLTDPYPNPYTNPDSSCAHVPKPYVTLIIYQKKRP